MLSIPLHQPQSPVAALERAMGGAKLAIFNNKIGVHAIASAHYDVIDLTTKLRFRIDKNATPEAFDLPGVSLTEVIQAGNATFRSAPGESLEIPNWLMIEGEYSPADYQHKEPAYPYPKMVDLKRELPGLLEILTEHRARSQGAHNLGPWHNLARPNWGNCGSACGVLEGEMIKRFGRGNVKLEDSDTCYLAPPLDKGHAYFTVNLLPDSGDEVLFQKPSRVIVDFTWIQFFATEIPGPSRPPTYTLPEKLIGAVPLPFVGTTDEMTEVLKAQSAFTTQSFGKQQFDIPACLRQLYQRSI